MKNRGGKFVLKTGRKCFGLFVPLALAVSFNSSSYNSESVFVVSASGNDTDYHLEDIVYLQDYLLGNTDNINSSLDYDINSDSRLNSIDLSLMKNIIIGNSSSTETNVINVSSTEELINAMKNAKAGDEIVVAPGEYIGTEEFERGSLFFSSASGTKQNPITIRSKDSDNKAVLSGTNFKLNYAMYITGDYWVIEDLEVTNTQKGIILDNSNYSKIKNVEVHHIGQEAIHLRDGSSYCQVDGVNVHDTGLKDEVFGEGVYIGSADSTKGYDHDCHDNYVMNSTIGPNVPAECIDIKEYASKNVVENCTLNGDGMTETDSLIDIKGSENIIRDCVLNINGNDHLEDGIQLHCEVDGWGLDNLVYGNKMIGCNDTQYLLRIWRGTSCTAYDNVREPENSEYTYRGYNGSTLTIK